MGLLKEQCGELLLQSGLDNEWWADSTECYCYLRNIQDLLSDGKTPYERRFGVPFNDPVVPFGAMVEYHPISAKTNLDCISLEDTIKTGIDLIVSSTGNLEFHSLGGSSHFGTTVL